MHEVLVNRLGGLSLPRKSVVRLTDRPDMTLDVYRGRKATIQYAKVKFGHIGFCIGKSENYLFFRNFCSLKVKTCFSQKELVHLEPKLI